MKPDINQAVDRGEPTSLMEPMRVPEGSRHRGAIVDLALELTARSAGFRSSLPDGVGTALADLVRAMNCYYSNLIEGHNTHPVDIERALKNDYSTDPHKRDLQLEARAHIAVQQWVDTGALSGRALTQAGVMEIHRRFCEQLPEQLLWAENPETGARRQVMPGQLRDAHVKVGRHIAISPGAIPRFLQRFEAAYDRLGKTDALLATAAAHHRLLWIHPFLDGNGRVARLVAHAHLLDALDTGGVWSVSRGFARNVQTYKGHLANCDLPRRNDLDGRGSLSEEALAAFTHFFLETCIDQIDFMKALVQPDRLSARIQMWAEEETRLGTLPSKSGALLEAILYRGELPRGEVPRVVDLGERQARRIVASLLARDVIASDSPRAPLRLAFPATLASRWMPGLFPEKG